MQQRAWRDSEPVHGCGRHASDSESEVDAHAHPLETAGRRGPENGVPARPGGPISESESSISGGVRYPSPGPMSESAGRARRSPVGPCRQPERPRRRRGAAGGLSPAAVTHAGRDPGPGRSESAREAGGAGCSTRSPSLGRVRPDGRVTPVFRRVTRSRPGRLPPPPARRGRCVGVRTPWRSESTRRGPCAARGPVESGPRPAKRSSACRIDDGCRQPARVCLRRRLTAAGRLWLGGPTRTWSSGD
jgi:hypothetical protein